MLMSNNLRESTTLGLKDKIVRVRNYQERSVPKFLKKIFNILEGKEFHDYVSWSNDGCAVVIKKPTEFAEKVLPLYFKHNNFASFVRQLNMYNFKKRKNYHYDHVYGHEMFQRGRSDLLRNIQRKCAENTPLVSTSSTDLKAHREDIDIDVDTLIQENIQYKRVHKSLSTQLQFIENKMRDLKNEIQVLNTQHQQQQANEVFLKNVVKNLATFYGQENIQRAIEAASIESSWTSEPESTYQDMSYEPSYTAKKETQFYGYDHVNTQSDFTTYTNGQSAPTTNYEIYEPVYTQKYANNGDAFGQLVRRNSYISNKNHVYDEQNSHIESLPIPHDFQAQGIFDSDDSDQKLDNDKSSSTDTYMSWYMEFEKNQMNADAFLGNHAATGNRDNGNLDIDGPISTENQLYYRADF